jgi:hypothetical protein
MTKILEATSVGAISTTDDVLSGVNLKGKQILVTGISAGIGVETARSLAAHGAQVVGTARDLNQAKALEPSRCERTPRPMAEASNWLNSIWPT